MSDMDRWLYEIEKKGLVSISCTWIERAASQKHPGLTLDLAHSVPLVYHELERVLLPREILN